MRHVEFGQTGLTVTPLGFGSAGVGELPHGGRLLNELLDLGVGVIDTAACYPGSERLIGKTIAHRRSEYTLISKCGHHEILPDGSMRSRPVRMSDIDAALRHLRTDYLDVMLLHSYDRDLLERGDALEVLDKARQAGKIRCAGYSGDNETAAVAAEMDVVDVLELSLSIADQSNIETVLPIARRRGLGVIAKRPIANAAWKHLGLGREDWPDHSAEYVARLTRMGLRPAALGIEQEDTSAAFAELALRFVTSLDGVHTAIVGTSSMAHLRENLSALARGPLPPETVQAVRRAFTDARDQVNDAWPGQN